MATTTLYAATEPFITLSTDTPANQQFEGTLQASLRIDRSIFGGTAGFGGFTDNLSEVTLINADSLYDNLSSGFSINGQPITFKLGQMSADGFTVDSYQQFELIALLTGERLRVDRSVLTLDMRDPSLHMDVPVQSAIYSGDGAELNGDDNVKGKRRPIAEGTVFNATPSLVLSPYQVFQYNIGNCQVLSVKDGGEPLTFALEAQTVRGMILAGALGLVPPGSYATCSELGYLMLGGANAFQVTCDLQGPRRDTASILKWQAVRASQLETWGADKYRTDGDATLSTDFLTAGSTATPTNFISRTSKPSGTAGKFCYRIVLNSGPTTVAFGFANERKRSAYSLIGLDTDPLVTTTGNSVGVYIDSPSRGTTMYMGLPTGEFGNAFASGDSILLAVDTGASLWWYKVGSGSWNANVAADPATGVGGFALHFDPGQGHEIFAAVGIIGGSVTADFYPLSLPSGFSQWGATPTFNIDYGTFDDLTTVQPAQVGFYLDQEQSTTFSDMCNQMMSGIGGWFGFSNLGRLQVYRFDAPDSSFLASYDTSGGNVLDVGQTALPDSLDPPPKRWRVNYKKNWTVLATLAADVTENDPVTADDLRNASRVASTSDAAMTGVVADFPDAPDPDPVQAFFALEADAQAEADRRLTLYASGFKCYIVKLTKANFVHEIGQMIQVTDSRIGLSAGKTMRIVQMTEDTSDMSTTAVAFG